MALPTVDCFLGETQEGRQLAIYEALLGIITDSGGSTSGMVTVDCFLAQPPEYRLRSIYEALLAVGDSAGGGGAGAFGGWFPFAASDETTPMTAGTSKITFLVIDEITLSQVAGFLPTGPAGSNFQFDIMVNGVSILSTKATIEAGEQNTLTATTQPVISNPVIPAMSIVRIDVLAVGSGTAGAGLKVYWR